MDVLQRRGDSYLSPSAPETSECPSTWYSTVRVPKRMGQSRRLAQIAARKCADVNLSSSVKRGSSPANGPYPAHHPLRTGQNSSVLVSLAQIRDRSWYLSGRVGRDCSISLSQRSPPKLSRLRHGPRSTRQPAWPRLGQHNLRGSRT